MKDKIARGLAKTAIQKIANRQGGVAFTFDAQYSSQVLFAAILEKYGARGTFFIDT